MRVPLMRGVVQRRKDVFALQVRVIRQALLVRSSRREQLENIRNTDAQPTNAGASPGLAGFHGDAIEAIQIHRISCNFDDAHYAVQRQEPAWEVASDEKMGKKRRGGAWGWGKWGGLVLVLTRRVRLG